MLPGPDVQIIDHAPPSAGVADTGTAFMVGLADRGATTGPLAAGDVVSSLADFTARYGARQSYSLLYDAVEAFFAEGGARVYISRFAGPAAVRAAANVPVSSSKFSATAKSVGAWGNNLTVSVSSGVITVKENGTVVEVSPVQADATAAAAWSTASKYIDIAVLASGALTDATNVALTGGADDRTNATDTQRQAALDRFVKALGPGQVLLPGDTRGQAHALIAAHALANNRFALGDAADTPTAATILTAAATDRALGRDQARHLQLLAPWLTAPGVSTGTTRSIPPSAVQAGMVARSDAATGNPNRAVAGRNGISRFATAVNNTYSDADRSSLADAGVTVLIPVDNTIQTYDDVTLVDPALDPEWLGAGGNREVMNIVTKAFAVAAQHMFNQEDGPVELSGFGGDLAGMLSREKQNRALFGATNDDAFSVNVGPTVNTPSTIQARQLRAVLGVKISPNARQVIIQLTNTPLTEAF
jgi:hypothetical protein